MTESQDVTLTTRSVLHIELEERTNKKKKKKTKELTTLANVLKFIDERFCPRRSRQILLSFLSFSSLASFKIREVLTQILVILFHFRCQLLTKMSLLDLEYSIEYNNSPLSHRKVSRLLDHLYCTLQRAGHYTQEKKGNMNGSMNRLVYQISEYINILPR